MDLFLWGGPVSTSDVAHVEWQRPTEVVTFNEGIGGIGSSNFSALAESFRGPDGRILPRLLASRGKHVENYEKISIGGFSAFHGLANLLLLSDGDSIAAAVLLDACFSALANEPKKGYLAFGSEAAHGEKLLVYTSSMGGGQTYTTGSACARKNFDAACAAAGALPVSALPRDPLPPMTVGLCEQAGDLHLLDYGAQFSHGDHVHKLGVPALDAYLVPYLAKAPLPIGPGPLPAPGEKPTSPSSSAGLWLLAGGAAVFVASFLWSRRSK